MDTSTSMQDRYRILGEILDHVTSLGIEVSRVEVGDRQDFRGEDATLHLRGGEPAVDALAEYLALGECEPNYLTYQRTGLYGGLKVAVSSMRARKVCICDADCHVHEAVSA